MKQVVLLDPGLVLPQKDSNPQAQAVFWLRFAEWIGDDRTRLGARSYSRLSSMYGALENPEYVPAPLRRSVHSTVGKILSKPPLQHDVADEAAELTVDYLSAHSQQTLVDDLVGTSLQQSVVLGSHPSFWYSTPETVGCIPAPPDAVTVHFEPGLPTAEERLEVMRRWFAGRKVVIVGGQVDRHIRQALVNEVGLDDAKLVWIPSEYNKKAANIPSVIAGLNPDYSIVVCITGKVGHVTSGSVEIACKKAGIEYNYVEHASSISELLGRLFDSGS